MLFRSYHKYEAALASYEMAEQKTTNPSILRRIQLRKGITLLRLGRLKEAEDIAKALARRYPEDLTIQALGGAVLYYGRRYSEAQAFVEKGAEKKNLACTMVCSMSDLILGAKARAYKQVRDSFKILDEIGRAHV